MLIFFYPRVHVKIQTALPLDGALEEIQRLHNDGNRIVFFTAREEQDREVTLTWLKNHGFPFESLITDKPRCLNSTDEYVWIDNRPVRAITYKGEWSPLIDIKNCWVNVQNWLGFSK